ncbi:nitroreductase family protein [Mobilitalea sibirica]|uniref:Nitroreductase family protein n=1 Tax=Mobilitalea sibirica TaxID=1462919 RepID=A0A8J7KUY3_9FIRM|nr:nitroreductase family protein [Mobilitalea sibirica]MBH1939520.1 nitroreductase family protein [Mobilitalea sibirica]
MNNNFKQIIENRRSIYAIAKASPISDEEIRHIVEHAVKYVPSSFNSQSARVVLLIGDQHDKLWEITREALRKIVPEGSFDQTDKKIDSFKNGYGTVMFFEDQEVVEGLQKQFELYKDNFPIWSLQSSGMLQYVIWASLEEEGLGASLQHYNPLIDEQVKNEWNLPKHWKLLAQMPFGKPIAAPEDKDFLPLEDRVKVYK